MAANNFRSALLVIITVQRPSDAINRPKLKAYNVTSALFTNITFKLDTTNKNIVANVAKILRGFVILLFYTKSHIRLLRYLGLYLNVVIHKRVAIMSKDKGRKEVKKPKKVKVNP